MTQYILLTECDDNSGLVAGITQVCSSFGFNIIKNSEFVDQEYKKFFMRTVLQSENEIEETSFLNELERILPLASKRSLVKKEKKKILVMATKEAHCLGDILMKNYFSALDVEIVAVISNYDSLKDITEKFDVPFYHVSHEGLSRDGHDDKVMEVLDTLCFDYIVLAKYMRILSEDFVGRFKNKIINIHHSFLPAFIGAEPYKQAYERGVKIIGASAHFVTTNLDEGPIISQSVISVDHSYDAEKLATAGRELEESVLLKAIQLVIAEKVFVYNNKTVVFN